MRIHFLLPILLVSVAHAQTPPAPDPVAAALQTQVEALNSGDTGALGTAVAWRERLYEFYAHRSFKAAWTDVEATAQLRRAIEESRTDGLDPNDYHLPMLVELESEVRSSGPEVRAKYDVLQTDALLRLGYHLSFGQVDPTPFDPQW